MNKRSKPPPWFGKPFPISDQPRRDFYLCTSCGVQSCGGLYSSTCTECGGISSDPPRGIRNDYLCTSCAHNRHVCTCDYPRLPTPVPPRLSTPVTLRPSGYVSRLLVGTVARPDGNVPVAPALGYDYSTFM